MPSNYRIATLHFSDPQNCHPCGRRLFYGQAIKFCTKQLSWWCCLIKAIIYQKQYSCSVFGLRKAHPLFRRNLVPDIQLPQAQVFTRRWRHQMETFSVLLALCVGNSPVTVNFPHKGQWRRTFDAFFDLCLNKLLSKQSWGWWFFYGNPPVNDGPPSQRRVTRGFDVFFDLHLNNRDAGDLRHRCVHYDVAGIITKNPSVSTCKLVPPREHFLEYWIPPISKEHFEWELMEWEPCKTWPGMPHFSNLYKTLIPFQPIQNIEPPSPGVLPQLITDFLTKNIIWIGFS